MITTADKILTVSDRTLKERALMAEYYAARYERMDRACSVFYFADESALIGEYDEDLQPVALVKV